MNERSQVIFIAVCTILIVSLLITGCVEVTPPSGTTNASAYGPVSQGGDIGKFADNLSKGDTNQDKKVSNTVKTTDQKDQMTQPDIQTPLPNVTYDTFVKVTPKDYSELKVDKPTSYLGYGEPKTSDNKTFVTIYELTNQTFANNASAYAYDLLTPPLYINLNFYPKMVEDKIERYKRTGDKEGTVVYSRIQPSRDSWFEMRIYNLDTGNEITREGYGKVYDITNKSAVIRSSGRLQFDFMGDDISVDISMKMPVNSSVVKEYESVNSLIEEKKAEVKLIPMIYLVESDLPEGWKENEGNTRTDTKYSSMFILQSAGSSINQDISRYPDLKQATDAYEQTKVKNSGEKQVSILTGDEGYGFESVRMNGVVFRQGEYVVEITSFAIPPVSFDDLKKYAGIVSNKINPK